MTDICDLYVDANIEKYDDYEERMSLLLAHVANIKNEMPKEAVMPSIFLVDFDLFMPERKWLSEGIKMQQIVCFLMLTGILRIG